MLGQAKENQSGKENPWQLIARIKSGDAQAFSELYRDFFVPVYRYLYARTWDKHLAEDLTQTVFLKVYRNITKIEDASSTPLTYFFTAARRVLSDHLAKKKDEPWPADWLESPENSGVAISPQDVIENYSRRQMIACGMSKLTEEHRQVLELKFFADLNIKEIASATNQTEAAIRQRQHRALIALKKILDQDPDNRRNE